MVDAKTIALLTDSLRLTILKEIADRKKANYKEIRSLVVHSTGRELNGELQKKLSELEKENLIGVVQSSYRDFNSYYLTAKGLETVKVLSVL